MTHAYDKDYLDDAMSCLGEAMDYVANTMKMDTDDFLDLFIATGFSEQFELGVPKIVSGLSGIELVMEVLTKAGTDVSFPEPEVYYDYSPAYWSGWILAYYQWYTGMSFKEIRGYISMKEIEALYHPLHEAHEMKFVDTLNSRIHRQNPPTRLQTQRKICGLTQSELAEKSGINLRTLQQYENRAKDINKAASISLLSLAKVLGCQMTDLLEYDTSEAL